MSTAPATLKIRLRQDEALNLRLAGCSYPEIARRLHYADKGRAHHAVGTALNRQPAEDAKAVRAMELARLDELLKVAWVQLHTDHVLVSAGQIVRDNDGVALLDHAGKLAGLDRVIRIMERRSRYLGVDAPVRRIIEVVDPQTIEARIAELEAELEANDGLPQPAK
ncbi:MAG: hypothetical protein M3Y91_09065 [Actinomycetota bacterium]|nr:hypothetical protein [Actinomycetota bacterium]